jgi:hypothetical protein
MTPYIEFVLFILLPALLATFINRFAFKDSIGNLRIVTYKLFRIFIILAIASQIQFKGDLNSFAGGYYALKYFGYILIFALVFDLFLIYPKNTSPNLLMSISNVSLWTVGLVFLITILDHYNDIQSNSEGVDGKNIWNDEGSFYGLNPMTNLKLLWEKRVMPKTNDIVLTNSVGDDKMLFNMFSSVKNSKKTFSLSKNSS